MPPHTVQSELEKTLFYIEQAENVVAKLKVIVADLNNENQPSAVARHILTEFETALAAHLRYRDVIVGSQAMNPKSAVYTADQIRKERETYRL